jgi:putative sigma-54 modulation protein
MRVIVKARHMNLTPALKAHAEEKLGKALMRIFDRPAAKIEIELNDIGNVRDGSNKECRVNVFVPRGKTVTIVEIDDNMYKAIDLAHDRILQQVKRENSKRRNITGNRKLAEREREKTARESLTVAPERWEQEVAEFESATVRA